MESKECSVCGVIFNPINNVQKYCGKECAKTGRKEYRKKYREEYYQKNKEWELKRNEEWRQKNIKRNKEYSKQYAKSDKGKRVKKKYNSKVEVIEVRRKRGRKYDTKRREDPIFRLNKNM